ncbi:hypothetical protein ACFLUO_00615 [Chloroflexota bacterium]
MLKQKSGQHKETKEGNLSDKIYAQTYNNFALLVEKSYSPRFINVTRRETLNIAEREVEPSKYERESQGKQKTAFTKDNFVVALKKVSRRTEKPKANSK